MAGNRLVEFSQSHAAKVCALPQWPTTTSLIWRIGARSV